MATGGRGVDGGVAPGDTLLTRCPASQFSWAQEEREECA